jgi:hypothetical protein
MNACPMRNLQLTKALFGSRRELRIDGEALRPSGGKRLKFITLWLIEKFYNGKDWS